MLKSRKANFLLSSAVVSTAAFSTVSSLPTNAGVDIFNITEFTKTLKEILDSSLVKRASEDFSSLIEFLKDLGDHGAVDLVSKLVAALDSLGTVFLLAKVAFGLLASTLFFTFGIQLYRFLNVDKEDIKKIKTYADLLVLVHKITSSIPANRKEKDNLFQAISSQFINLDVLKMPANCKLSHDKVVIPCIGNPILAEVFYRKLKVLFKISGSSDVYFINFSASETYKEQFLENIERYKNSRDPYDNKGGVYILSYDKVIDNKDLDDDSRKVFDDCLSLTASLPITVYHTLKDNIETLNKTIFEKRYGLRVILPKELSATVANFLRNRSTGALNSASKIVGNIQKVVIDYAEKKKLKKNWFGGLTNVTVDLGKDGNFFVKG